MGGVGREGGRERGGRERERERTREGGCAWLSPGCLGTQISEQFSAWVIGSLMCILPLQDPLITLDPYAPSHTHTPLPLSLGLLWSYYNDNGDKGHLSLGLWVTEDPINRSGGKEIQSASQPASLSASQPAI